MKSAKDILYNMGGNVAETSLSLADEYILSELLIMFVQNSEQNPVDLLTKTLHLLHSVDAVFLSLSSRW